MQGHNSKAADELIEQTLKGQISRRDVMKRAAALGLSAPLAATLMRAHGVAAQDATPATQPVGYSIVVPQGLRTDLKGHKIAWVGTDEGAGAPFEEAAIKQFVDATGIEVERIAGATSTTDRLANYLQFLGAQASTPDVMMIDVIHPGILAQHAIDVSDVLEAENADFFERIVQNNTVNDQLVAIPWYTDAGVLYYRTDLLQKYEYDAPPETWDDLEAMAQKIIDGERATNPDFQGFVFQGSAYEGLTCDALEWQASNGGGEIIDADGNITVNNPQAIAAFERAKGWVNGIAPEGVTTYDEEAARGVWQAGNAAFMRNWPYAYSLGQAADSVIKDKFEVSQLPMGSGDGAKHTACLGGWQIMISKYSKEQDAAKEFMKYIASPELQKAYAIERSLLPTIGTLYDDEAVLAANPFFGKLKAVFQGGASARPSTPSGDLYNNVSTEYFTTVNQILTGQKDAESAVKDLEGKLEDIMSQL